MQIANRTIFLILGIWALCLVWTELLLATTEQADPADMRSLLDRPAVLTSQYRGPGPCYEIRPPLSPVSVQVPVLASVLGSSCHGLGAGPGLDPWPDPSTLDRLLTNRD